MATKQDPMRYAGHLQSEHTKRAAQNKQPKEADEDKNILLVKLCNIKTTSKKIGFLFKQLLFMASCVLNMFQASVSERGMRSESQRAMALQNPACLWEQIPGERSCSTGGNAQVSSNSKS